MCILIVEFPLVNDADRLALTARDGLRRHQVNLGPDTEHGAQGRLEVLFHALDLAHQVGELIGADLNIHVEVTYTQYIVLLALWEYGKTTVGELCRALYLDCGTLTPLLKKMEENGWVVRTRSKGDERVVNVSLTDTGWKMREQVKNLPEQVGGCIAMPREDLYTLYTLLRRLLETVE